MAHVVETLSGLGTDLVGFIVVQRRTGKGAVLSIDFL